MARFEHFSGHRRTAFFGMVVRVQLEGVLRRAGNHRRWRRRSAPRGYLRGKCTWGGRWGECCQPGRGINSIVFKVIYSKPSQRTSTKQSVFGYQWLWIQFLRSLVSGNPSLLQWLCSKFVRHVIYGGSTFFVI